MPNKITRDAEITKRGLTLARKLAPMLGSTAEIDRTCSLIVRHARTYNRIQEVWCSVELDKRQTSELETRESALERRLTDLVEWLPDTDAGPIRVAFSGDPRGHCVKLTLPADLRQYADVWDGESIGADVDN